jgi:hypothetical protein
MIASIFFICVPSRPNAVARSSISVPNGAAQEEGDFTPPERKDMPRKAADYIAMHEFCADLSIPRRSRRKARAFRVGRCAQVIRGSEGVSLKRPVRPPMLPAHDE